MINNEEKGMFKKIGFSVILTLFIAFQGFSQQNLNYKSLYRYLVDLKGWKCEEPTGSLLKTPMGTAINAKRNCIKGNKSVNAQILAGTMATMAWAPFSMVVEYDSPEQFVKTKNVYGFKEVIMHDKSKENPGGTIAVLLSQKAGVPYAIFVINYNNLDYKEAEKIVKKYPIREMAEVLSKELE
jgi:hypothetical protein